MQIAMFCRRDDEAAYYEKFGKQYGVTLKLLDEIPTPQTASLAEGCLCASIITTPVPPQTLDALWEAGVRYLSTRTIGYDHIDLAYAKKIGMHVGNVSYSPDSVADYALMLILMAVRRCKSILRHAAVQNYTLPGMQGRELPRLTVGVAGTGGSGAPSLRVWRGLAAAFWRTICMKAKTSARLRSMCPLIRSFPKAMC